MDQNTEIEITSSNFDHPNVCYKTLHYGNFRFIIELTTVKPVHKDTCE